MCNAFCLKWWHIARTQKRTNHDKKMIENGCHWSHAHQFILKKQLSLNHINHYTLLLEYHSFYYQLSVYKDIRLHRFTCNLYALTFELYGNNQTTLRFQNLTVQCLINASLWHRQMMKTHYCYNNGITKKRLFLCEPCMIEKVVSTIY